MEAHSTTGSDKSIGPNSTSDSETTEHSPSSSGTTEDTKCASEQQDTTNETQEGPSSPTSIDAQSRAELIRLGRSQSNLEMLNKASETGNLKLVQLVLEATPSEVDLSTLKSEDDDMTPLQHASKAGHRDIVQLLLERNFSPLVEDPNRNTPLHLAASNGHTGIALDILECVSKHDRDVSESSRLNIFHRLNDDARSPLGCALLSPEPHISVAKEFLSYAEGKPENAFPDFAKVIFPKFESRSLNKPVNLYVLGDHNVGKSTVICALQEDSSLLSAIANRRTIEDTYKHFSGIVTTDFSSPSFKRVVFYDLAGHTNYFNEKLFESVDDLANSVFLILVNLKDDRPRIFERLIYWLNLLHYYVLRSGCAVKPKTLIVGSHVDMRKTFWRSNERLVQIYNDVVENRPHLAKCFEFVMKPVSVDCRKLASFEIRHLRSSLQRICQRIKPPSMTQPSSMCYILTAAFDSPALKNQPVLCLGELASKLAEDASSPGLNFSKLLPHQPDQLLSLCKTLHDHERILLFDNPASMDIESTWIVHNSRLLLTEIDKQLTSLNTSVEGSNEKEETQKSVFRETFLANSGIVSRDTLENALASQHLNLDPKLTVQLLQYYKYCEAVFTNSADSQDQYFFLPGLLGDIGRPDPWEGDGFSFAWCVAPSKDQEGVFEFFLPRYLKKLLLALIQRFIQNPASFGQVCDDQSSESSIIERSEVGNRAISWLTSEGVHIIIVINDDAIILNMYCSQRGTEFSCLQLRNRILSVIREQKDCWQPGIKTTEFLIPFGERFPVRKTEYHQCISLHEVRQAMLKGQQDYDGISIQSLVFHDPCIILYKLDKMTQSFLLDVQTSDQEVSQDFLREIHSTLSRDEKGMYAQYHLPDIISTRSPSPVDPSSHKRLEVSDAAMKEFNNSEVSLSSSRRQHMFHTYADLLRHFNSFSICKATDFLIELQEKSSPSHDDSKDDSVLADTENLDEKDNVFNRQISGASTLRRESDAAFVCIDRVGKEDLPFVNSITKFSCDSEGATINSEQHGIMIKILPGAVSKTSPPIEIEFGVLLSGPFEVPMDVRIVSPILWFGTAQKNFKFNNRVEICLPHCIDIATSDVSKNLAFCKSSQSDAFTDIPFMLTQTKDQTRFTGFNGILSTKHPSFLCICYKAPKEMVQRSRYSIISAIPRENSIIDSTFTLHFFVTLALRTCLEMVSRQFPGYDFVRKNFKFKVPVDGSEPALDIHYESTLPHGWVAPLKGFTREILLSEANILNTLDDCSDYPPRFTIDISGDSAVSSEVLQVSFSGATRQLNSEHFLKFTGIRTRTPSIGSRGRYDSKRSLTICLVPQFLKRHLNVLVQLLDVDQISSHLSQLGVLTHEEKDDFLAMRRQVGIASTGGTTKNAVIEKLVNTLSSKGVEGIVKFATALERTTDCTGHNDILKAFREDQDYEQIVSTTYM